MKSRLDERMPWPKEYFAFEARGASPMASIPDLLIPKLRRIETDAPIGKPKPATMSPVEVPNIQDLSVRDVRRIRWARGAGLLGPIYGWDGLYLVTDPALGVNPQHQFQQGRYMTIQDLREHIRKLEDCIEKELHGKTTEKHGRRTAG